MKSILKSYEILGTSKLIYVNPESHKTGDISEKMRKKKIYIYTCEKFIRNTKNKMFYYFWGTGNHLKSFLVAFWYFCYF